MAREDVTNSLLKAISLIDHKDLLAQHLPIGRIWTKSFNPDTTFGKLILGLAGEYYRLGVLTEHISNEIDIDQTNELLVDWEKSMGIPNDIFLTDVSISTRRTNIKYLLSNFGGVQTAEDFERVAAYFGYDVDVYPGVSYGSFPLTFPIMFFSSTKAVKFTIIIHFTEVGVGDYYFPLTFPLHFSSGGSTFLKNLFELLAPANCLVLITTLEP